MPGFQLSSHNELQEYSHKLELKLLVENSQIVNVLKHLQGKGFILGDIVIPNKNGILF